MDTGSNIIIPVVFELKMPKKGCFLMGAEKCKKRPFLANSVVFSTGSVVFENR